jgi:parvulin-like peptidyl-prolyl isomerase
MRRLLVVLALLAVGCAPSAEPEMELASVAGTPIKLSRYRTEYVGYLGRTGLPDEDSRRRAYLNRMIAVELIVRESRDGGVEQTEAFQLEQARFREKALIEGWLADEVFADIRVDPEDEEAMLVRINTQLTARHLFAPSLSEATALAGRLEAGEAFQDLASEVFADPVLAANGGLVGVFGFDEMDPAFEEAAYALEIGEVSGPVRTAQGFSIIRLVDRFVKPVMTDQEFASRRPQIREYVTRVKKGRARRAVLEEIMAEAKPVLNQESAEAFLSSISQTVDSRAVEESAESSIALLPLVTFQADGEGVIWTVGDFVRAARTTSEGQRSLVDSRGRLQALVEGLVARHIMVERAVASGLSRDQRVRDAMAAAEAEWIYEYAYNDLINQVSVPEESVRSHYEANRSEYVIPERVALSEIVAATRRQADSLRAELGKSEFAALARRSSLRPGTAALGGSLGFLSKDELGPWADQVFASQPGAVLGPLEAAGKYLLLQIGVREPSRAATLAEAEPRIRAELKQPLQQAYLRTHVEEMRAKYAVRVLVDSFAALPLRNDAHVSS